jgi:hypothetical protein
MSLKPFFTLCALGAAALFAHHSHAQTYDAVADFSTSLNTASSTWSYRVSTNGLARDGAYALLPTFGSLGTFTGPAAGTSAWVTPGLPAVGVNLTGADQTFTQFGPAAAFVWPAGTMLIHPGPGSLAVVSWLAASEANLSMSFRFKDMDPNGVPSGADGIGWFVERNNGSSTLASGSILVNGDTGVLGLSGVHVMAGDRINFVVSPLTGYGFDSTQFGATIVATPVPEPTALALWCAGLVVTVAVARRRAPRGTASAAL